jgi:hypothetical protein
MATNKLVNGKMGDTYANGYQQAGEWPTGRLIKMLSTCAGGTEVRTTRCALLTSPHCTARPYTPTKRRARAGGGVAPAHPTDMSDTVSAPYSSSRPPMVHPVLETKVKSRPRTERHNPRLPSSMCHCQTTCETHHKSAQSRKHPAPQQNTKKPPAL